MAKRTTLQSRIRRGMPSGRLCVILPACYALAACAHYHERKVPVAQTAQQVANIYISAYPEVPWSSISSLLTPNLKLTIQQAQNIAASTTEAQSLLLSTVLAGNLGINLPTTGASPGAQSSATTQPSTLQSPGSIPPLPTLPQAATPTNVAPSTALAPVDGSELLVTSTALFQQAAILDNQISQQYIPHGYTAHLITFQINIQPLRDDWSYDAFVDITLIPSSLIAGVENSLTTHANAGAPGPIVVKPLIITDALETSSVQQSVQQIRQALLQLSGSIGKTGLGAGFGAGSNSQRGLASYDKNSLVTAGRVSDDTIRIRLGAAYSGAGQPALIPRTYNVSLFVLTKAFVNISRPSGESSGKGTSEHYAGVPIDQISVITHTFFLRADSPDLAADPTSNFLPEVRHRSDLAKKVSDTVKSYGYDAVVHGCTYRGFVKSTRGRYNIDSPEQIDAYLDLLRAADREDFESLEGCLGIHLGALEVTDEEKFKFFYSALLELQANTHFSDFIIPLKDATPRLPDSEQLAVVSDSADLTQETVTLVGGENLTSDQLRAEAAVLMPDGQLRWLSPTSMTLSVSKPYLLAITFPNPAKLTVIARNDVAAPKNNVDLGATLLGVQLYLSNVGEHVANSGSYEHLAKLSLTAGSKGSAPQSTAGATGSASPAVNLATQVCAGGQKAISVSSNIVSTDGMGGVAQITVGDMGKLMAACSQGFGVPSTPSLAPPLSLTVAGAAVVPDGACIASQNGKIALNATGLCTSDLQLSDIQPGIPIVLSVTDANGTAIGTPIQLYPVPRFERR